MNVAISAVVRTGIRAGRSLASGAVTPASSLPMPCRSALSGSPSLKLAQCALGIPYINALFSSDLRSWSMASHSALAKGPSRVCA